MFIDKLKPAMLGLCLLTVPKFAIAALLTIDMSGLINTSELGKSAGNLIDAVFEVDTDLPGLPSSPNDVSYDFGAGPSTLRSSSFILTGTPGNKRGSVQITETSPSIWTVAFDFQSVDTVTMANETNTYGLNVQIDGLALSGPDLAAALQAIDGRTGLGTYFQSSFNRRTFESSNLQDTFQITDVQVGVTPVPAALPLMGVGIAALLFAERRRHHAPR